MLLSAQDTVFIKSYGLKGYNYGEKIIQSKDNGYLILGNKTGVIGNTDAYVVKTNYSGNLQWDKAYGDNDITWAEDFVQTKDKGYIITGYKTIPPNNDYNFLLLKIDSVGKMEWMKDFGGSGWDMGHSIIETPDSGYIMAGETYSYGNGNNDVFLIKTDKKGDSLWSKFYGGAGNDVAYDISACHDGNYIVTGMSNSFGKGEYDAYLLKIDPLGDTLWTRIYGDTSDNKTFAGIETSDHGIALTGSTKNYNAKALDGMILKTDSAGNFKWVRVYGGTEDEEFYDIVQDSKENLMVTGYTESYGYVGTKDFYTVLADKNGWFIFGEGYGGNKADVSNSCVITSDKGSITVGSTESMGLGLSNILVVKRDSTGYTNTSSYVHVTAINELSEQTFSIFPNPVTEFLTVESNEEYPISNISLYNQLGQIMYTYKPSGKQLYATIDFSDIPKGLYIIAINYKDNITTRKIIHK